jgi:hypothetical protein
VAAYGRIILPSGCMHTRADTWELPGCSGRFSNCIYYMSHQYCNKSKSQLTSPTLDQLPAVAVSTGHIVCARHCPAAAAVSQTACSAVICSGRIPNCMHVAAVALLQWQNTKLHARVAALLQWQVSKRHGSGRFPYCLIELKDEQTCNNSNNSNSKSNNKARCIPTELCMLSRVKTTF